MKCKQQPFLQIRQPYKFLIHSEQPIKHGAMNIGHMKRSIFLCLIVMVVILIDNTLLIFFTAYQTGIDS